MARQGLAKNLKQLERQIMKDANVVLANEVANDARDKQEEAIEDVVYGAAPPGSPTHYGRRRDVGGLTDRNNMIVNFVKDGVIELRNETPPKKPWNVSYVAENLVSGYGSEDRWYNQPRDFVLDTEKRILAENSHAVAMREGLIKLGYTVI